MRDAGDTAALHEREPRFRAIFEAAAIGIGLFDLDGRPVETNLAFQQLLGYSAEELRGMPFPAFTHPEDLEADLALARELIAGQRDTYQIEKRYVRKDGAVIWGRLTVSLVRDAAGTPRYAIGMVEDITERVRMCTRRDALLRLARHLAVETAPDRVMQKLLGEAVALTGGSFGLVASWDEPRQVLHPVWNTLPIPDEPVDLRLGEGAGGQAAARREPVVINDYQAAAVAVALARRAGVRAMVAAPLLHGARLLGVVTVASTAPGKRFAPEDAGLLEVLAGLASAVLVGIERSRLEGALLAARTAQHALNNQLSAVVGYADLLTEDPRLLEELRLLAQEILVGAQDAAQTVQRLGQITRLEEVDRGGPGPVLDLARSTAPSST
jgi:PAS domain S-box-containing protein